MERSARYCDTGRVRATAAWLNLLGILFATLHLPFGPQLYTPHCCPRMDTVEKGSV